MIYRQRAGRRAFFLSSAPWAALALLLPAHANAQSAPPPPPDPGVISSQVLEQQRERLDALETPADPGPAVTGERPADANVTGEDTIRFELRTVVFDQSRFLSPQELSEVAAPFVGRQVSFADLGAITAAVNAMYDARGLVTARAILAPQAIENGTVRITLVEGVVGQIEVGGARRIAAQDIVNRSGLEPGETLDPRDLERRLSLINRTNPVQVRAGLQPGEQFGLTDIQLAVTMPDPNILQVFADNHGYRSVGRWEGGGYYRRTGLLGASDRLSAFAVASEGALSGTVSYDAAVLGPTTRLGLSYGRSRSEIVNGAFAAAGSVGKTQNLALNYLQPVVSSARGILLASATVGVSETRNFVSDTFVSKTTTKKAGVGLSYDHLAPGFSLRVSGNALIADSPLTGSVSDQTYGVFSGTFEAEKRTGPRLGLRAFGGWQIATQDGVPGDLLFQIGGPLTNRGYEPGALSGDGGYYLSGEIEMLPASDSAEPAIFVFVDHGRVATPRDQPKSLTAIGAGIGFTALDILSVQATAGFPVERLESQSRNPQFYLRTTLQF
ncbi:ShlB/FhaC/HecB family hemolysin secretion/activation protein [Aurantiacibacter zhengii]|uniref:ShlB/FhaC/HecB family hemolysin secretion/activation protein n=1 Tax=Aurantiacibacter zhengii TaxID=2307003 RepID=A0A418NRR2_9SPHN|nr:ShlB/FhaC/HecB family hemolysin secretion/activation protein [Aurantiacibacter zhengii]